MALWFVFTSRSCGYYYPYSVITQTHSFATARKNDFRAVFTTHIEFLTRL